jgi:hypothetical protein
MFILGFNFKKMKKILYCLLNGQLKNDRIKNVINTWGKDVDLIFYSDFEDLENNVYKVIDKQGYWDLEEKHINGIKFVGSNFKDYEWYFFGDDDTFVNTKKMNDFLNSCNEDVVYGLLINCYPKNESLFYHSGGAGVLIHKKNLDIISQNIELKNTKFADVTLGMCLHENKINVDTDIRFKSEPPKFYKFNSDEIKNYITFHHINSFEEMMELYQNSNQE